MTLQPNKRRVPLIGSSLLFESLGVGLIAVAIIFGGFGNLTYPIVGLGALLAIYGNQLRA